MMERLIGTNQIILVSTTDPPLRDRLLTCGCCRWCRIRPDCLLLAQAAGSGTDQVSIHVQVMECMHVYMPSQAAATALGMAHNFHQEVKRSEKHYMQQIK